MKSIKSIIRHIEEDPTVLQVATNKMKIDNTSHERSRIDSEEFFRVVKYDMISQLTHKLIDEGIIKFHREDDGTNTTISCRLMFVDESKIEEGGEK